MLLLVRYNTKGARMIKEQKVTYKLTVTAYHDGELDKEELRQKLLETLKNDNWDCSLNTVTNKRLSFDLPASIVAFPAYKSHDE